MKPDRKSLVDALLDRYGRTYAEELRIPVARNTPAALYQLLNMALLMSARISAKNAMQAAQALLDAGLKTPKKVANTTWQQRVDVITWHGYKRYDERTSTMLGDTASLLLDRYGGDLRRLRDEADHDVAREKNLLQQFKGIGPVGADIFLREVQGAWHEVYPYADDRVKKVAAKLGLGRRSEELARLVPRARFPQLAAALVRLDLDDGYAALEARPATGSTSAGERASPKPSKPKKKKSSKSSKR